MKSRFLMLTLLLAATLLSVPSRGADITGSLALSPDHPSTWTNGADNIHQALRWDNSKHMLFADVKFSTVDYADSVNTTEVEDYALSFPTVRFDPQSDRLIAGGVGIGTLKHGFFGSEVALDKGVELDVTRHHHGKIYAALNRVPDPDED